MIAGREELNWAQRSKIAIAMEAVLKYLGELHLKCRDYHSEGRSTLLLS